MAAGLYETVAWGRKSNGEKFEKMTIKRNLPGDDDVTFDLKYCGICHTDVHIANNDMGQFNLKFCYNGLSDLEIILKFSTRQMFCKNEVFYNFKLSK